MAALLQSENTEKFNKNLYLKLMTSVLSISILQYTCHLSNKTEKLKFIMYTLSYETHFQNNDDGEKEKIGGQYPTPDRIKHFIEG